MLIALHGKIDSGKDAAFLRLKELRPEAQRAAFADKLKISAMRSLGFENPEGELIGIANELKSATITIDFGIAHRTSPFSITGRQYLQWYGTEGHRDVFDDDFWVNQALYPLLGDDLDHSDKLVAVTDCRFPNEAERILSLGGQVWEIIGPPPAKTDNHPSETSLPEEMVTLSIDNTERNDGFAQLDAAIEGALSTLVT